MLYVVMLQIQIFEIDMILNQTYSNYDKSLTNQTYNLYNIILCIIFVKNECHSLFRSK